VIKHSRPSSEHSQDLKHEENLRNLEMGEEEENETSVDGAPNFNDYMAGAMISNGVIWIWGQLVGTFEGFFSGIPAGIIADLSYVLYLLVTIVASMLVCSRASTGHLMVGARFAGTAWVLSLLIMITTAPNPSPGLAIALLMIFAMGGIAGAYLTIRRRMRRPDLALSGGGSP